MFGEPAFDILLALYIEGDAQPVMITTLVEAVGTPMTTTLRWVEALERERWSSASSNRATAVPTWCG